jgi:hypothetical protein
VKARAAIAVLLALSLAHGTAVGAEAPAAEPFPVVPLERPAPRSHAWSYAALLSGAALVGGSFLVTDRANARYDEYLEATEPARIESLYDETLRLDAIARATLFSGEALVATGLYLRFIRRPPPPRSLSWSLTPHRCAVSLHF